MKKLIAAAVLGLPEKTLRYKPLPDKWCIGEILGHMADLEILYVYYKSVSGVSRARSNFSRARGTMVGSVYV